MDYWIREQKAKDELTKAEQKTLRRTETLQRSLANAPSPPFWPLYRLGQSSKSLIKELQQELLARQHKEAA